LIAEAFRNARLCAFRSARECGAATLGARKFQRGRSPASKDDPEKHDLTAASTLNRVVRFDAARWHIAQISGKKKKTKVQRQHDAQISPPFDRDAEKNEISKLPAAGACARVRSTNVGRLDGKRERRENARAQRREREWFGQNPCSADPAHRDRRGCRPSRRFDSARCLVQACPAQIQNGAKENRCDQKREKDLLCDGERPALGPGRTTASSLPYLIPCGWPMMEEKEGRMKGQFVAPRLSPAAKPGCAPSPDGRLRRREIEDRRATGVKNQDGDAGAPPSFPKISRLRAPTVAVPYVAPLPTERG